MSVQNTGGSRGAGRPSKEGSVTLYPAATDIERLATIHRALTGVEPSEPLPSTLCAMLFHLAIEKAPILMGYAKEPLERAFNDPLQNGVKGDNGASSESVEHGGTGRT